jgi:uncharacterized protein YciI
MGNHKRHKVKKHQWVFGKLQTFTVEFNSLEEAIAHANSDPTINAKVYTEDGELVHSNAAIVATYA